MIEILDTNVLVRFLTRDNEEQYKQAVVWFKEAEKGKRKIVIMPLVVAETCFVLESFYKKDKDEISEKMEALLSQRWLKVFERKTMIFLWRWYKKNYHFVDSFLIAWAKTNKGKVLGFDKDLLKAINPEGGRA